MTTAEELRREGMIEGEKIGEERGKIEGKIEGKAERDVEIVKNALQMGMDYDQITQLTGLSSDEIEKIKGDENAADKF